jgi:hypothetical protein
VPLFYFDIHENGVSDRDASGVELPDFEAAREQAVLAIKDATRDEVLEGTLVDVSTAYIEIRDEGGLVLAAIRYGEVLGLSWPPPAVTGT